MSYTFIKTSEVVQEGSNITITLINPELFDGTVVPYVLFGTGITLSDFQGLPSLANSFVMSSGKSEVNLNISADLTSEGSETVTLILTGSSTGAGLSTSFLIADTSKTPSNVAPAQFIVTADVPIVEEGGNVIFTVTATGVASGPGTIVPYSIVGIQQEDLVGTNVNGVLVFESSGVGSQLVANLNLSISEDFLDEGIETIVLLLNPDFPYTLEVDTSVQVSDTSLDTLPRIFLERIPTVLSEQGEDNFEAEISRTVRIRLLTENIPDGFAPKFKLVPVFTGTSNQNEVTFDDFESIAGITDFSGWNSITDFEAFFPPTVDEESAIFIKVKPDTIIEGSEYFRVILPDYDDISSGLIEIVDNTTFNEKLRQEDGIYEVRPAYSNTISTGGLIQETYVSKIDGIQINTSIIGKTEPYWKNSRGLLSAPSYIQGRTYFSEEDSAVYYQPFSYVVKSKISLETWFKSVKEMVHPAGLAAFGEINIDTDLDAIPSIASSSIGSLQIAGIFTITMDDTIKNIRASSTIYTNDLVSFNITADFSFNKISTLI